MAAADQPPTGNQKAAGPPPAAPTVDITKLAEKVYQLMLRDLRLDQARSARSHRR